MKISHKWYILYKVGLGQPSLRQTQPSLWTPPPPLKKIGCAHTYTCMRTCLERFSWRAYYKIRHEFCGKEETKIQRWIWPWPERESRWSFRHICNSFNLIKKSVLFWEFGQVLWFWLEIKQVCLGVLVICCFLFFWGVGGGIGVNLSSFYVFFNLIVKLI